MLSSICYLLQPISASVVSLLWLSAMLHYYLLRLLIACCLPPTPSCLVALISAFAILFAIYQQIPYNLFPKKGTYLIYHQLLMFSTHAWKGSWCSCEHFLLPFTVLKHSCVFCFAFTCSLWVNAPPDLVPASQHQAFGKEPVLFPLPILAQEPLEF